MIAKVKLKEYNFNTIKISGSKNSGLPIVAASILCDDIVTISNVPNISDILILIKLLNYLGHKTLFFNNILTVYPSTINKKIYHNKLINKIRGSYYLIGALIGKNEYNDFSFLYPGGCKLGTRPIDYHINAFRNMGLEINTNNKLINIRGYKKNTIHNLPYPSVGATINIILASCKIENETIINNASIEPEVIDLCNFLRSMGVSIRIKERTIFIIGKKILKSTKYRIMEDRIEAGTFLILGAIHKGIKITNINPNNLVYLTDLLFNIGYKLNITTNSITIFNHKENLSSFNIKLEPHPGFPTDLGPLICVLASKLNGTSFIEETVFKDRFSHIKELKKQNININCNNYIISVKKSNNIKNSTVKAHDLRCAAALLLSSSLSYKYSKIKNIEYLFRGYDNIIDKLKRLGIEVIIK